MRTARDEVAVCALSGAVGTYATIDPRVEKLVAEKLGLSVESISTQVVARDRHAAFFAAAAVTASSLERLATEIRHLQRSEVGEVAERFAPKQKGSSAMPHKKNPVLSENVTGLARMIRAMSLPAMENVALWHERDISHSSAERMIAPDVSALLDFALARMTDVIENLEIDVERMRVNLEAAGDSIYSQSVLLALVDGGMAREDAYATVQCAAHGAQGFRAALVADPQVSNILSRERIAELFDVQRLLQKTATIYDRMLGDAGQSTSPETSKRSWGRRSPQAKGKDGLAGATVVRSYAHRSVSRSLLTTDLPSGAEERAVSGMAEKKAS